MAGHWTFVVLVGEGYGVGWIWPDFFREVAFDQEDVLSGHLWGWCVSSTKDHIDDVLWPGWSGNSCHDLTIFLVLAHVTFLYLSFSKFSEGPTVLGVVAMVFVVGEVF